MVRFILISLLVFLTTAARAEWDILKTPHFTCFYPKGYRWEAEQALANLEYYREDVVKLTGNKEIGNLAVVIGDIGITSNGMANPIFKYIDLFTYSPSGEGIENWYREVGVHEYTHIGHLTRTGGWPKVLTTIFGTPFQPNLYSPGWIAEGITVFAESQTSPYEGRLNDGGYDALIQANVKEGKFPSLHKVTYSPLEVPWYEGIYLYGGEFFRYLAERYGQDKFSQFFEAYGSSSLAYYSPIFPALSLDRLAKKVYGKSFPRLFSEWQNSLDATSWQIDGERLTRRGWMVSSPILQEGKLYYICNYPKKSGAFSIFDFTEVMERDLSTQQEKVVISSTSGFVGGLKKMGDKLYYAEIEQKKGYANNIQSGFGFYAILQEKNLVSGNSQVLFEDEIRNFAVLPEGRIIYARDKDHGFGSELWVWSAAKGKRLLADFNLIISEILALGEGRLAVVAKPDWKNSNIYLLDLNTKELKPVAKTPFAETGISISGKRLFFSANYEGEYRIYAYDLVGEGFSQLTTSGLASFPVFDEMSHHLYFVGLSSWGFDLYRKRIKGFEEFLIKDYPESIPPAFPEISAQKGGWRDYIKTLRPRVHSPYLTKDGVGIYIAGQDAIAENSYSFDYWYEKEGPRFAFSYFSLRFKPSTLSFNWEEKEEVELHWRYPLRSKISSPLSVWVGVGGRKFDRFQRKEINPSLSFFLNFPKTKMVISADYFLEREKELGSTIDREAIKAGAWLGQYLKDSQIALRLSGVYDPDNPEATKFKIRGYDKLEGKKGLTASLEYSRPLLKIRKGIWNPNLFFEDLCLSLFAEAAFLEEKTPSSGGVELKQEAGASFGVVRFAPTLGLAYNKERETTVYLQAGLLF